jgi:hypothetical protein
MDPDDLVLRVCQERLPLSLGDPSLRALLRGSPPRIAGRPDCAGDGGQESPTLAPVLGGGQDEGVPVDQHVLHPNLPGGPLVIGVRRIETCLHNRSYSQVPSALRTV